MDAAGKLQVVGRAGVGFDNIDIESATGHGVIVVNAPSSNTISAAEHTLAMMLSVARHVPQAHSSLAGGEWNRRKFLGTELRGKTLGVIGLGRIGSEVARRAAAFEMRIIGYDPFVAEEHGRHLGAEIVSLEAIYEQSDIITLHTPMTDSTRRLIGEPELARMKNGAILVNCARGGLVDEDALHAAIEDGRIGGAALDVFITEPPEDSPLFRHPNVVVTPHLGASTEEAQSNVAREVAEQMIDVFEGRAPRYAVNAPLVPPETAAELAPYVPLALVVGRLASELADGQPERLSISFRGAVAELATDILAAHRPKRFSPDRRGRGASTSSTPEPRPSAAASTSSRARTPTRHPHTPTSSAWTCGHPPVKLPSAPPSRNAARRRSSRSTATRSASSPPAATG